MVSKLDENRILGIMCKEMSLCPVHRHYVLGDIRSMLLPPIRLNQFLLFRGAEQRGVLTWALLNEETAAKHVENRTPLTYEEWQSGNQFWIISLIGTRLKPHLFVPRLIKEVRQDVVRYIRRNPERRVRKVVELRRRNHGIHVSSQHLCVN